MIDVAGFLTGCVEHAGGLAEGRDGLLDVLVPPPLVPSMGGREEACLAVDPRALEGRPDALPAVPGTPALDAMVEYAGKQGRVSSASPRLEAFRPRCLAGEIQHALTFSARRVRLPEGLASVEPSALAQFDFVVSLVSDDREEQLQTVVVDLWSGRPNRALSRIVHTLDVEPGTVTAGRRRVHSLESAFEAACGALRGWLTPRVEAHQILVTRRLRDEHGRLALYYAAVAADLEKRIERANGDAERAQGLRSKLEAARQEQEAKLSELMEKYRLRPSARLAAIRVLTYPRLYSAVGLDRRQVSRELEVCWDPVLGRLQLPTCETCREETARLELGADGLLRCPDCAI